MTSTNEKIEVLEAQLARLTETLASLIVYCVEEENARRLIMHLHGKDDDGE